MASCCGAAACLAVAVDGELGLADVKLGLAAVADGPMQGEAVDPVSQKAMMKGVFACNLAEDSCWAEVKVNTCFAGLLCHA